MNAKKRKKRQLNFPDASLLFFNDIDSIISLSNQNSHSHYYFQYNESLENLIHVEFILSVKNLTKFSLIHLQSDDFSYVLQQPFSIERNLLKINLTQYIKSFPVKFFIKLNNIFLHSSGFLTLYFRRSIFPSRHSIIRRDLSSFYDSSELVTQSNDPLSCQVRPMRISFSEFNWTSWIVEPSSYEMNICSGMCPSNSKMPSYFKMQFLMNKINPRKIPTLCCKPKRFSPLILLYYDGLNLILKQHDNMRVVECGCF